MFIHTLKVYNTIIISLKYDKNMVLTKIMLAIK